jgi:toxin HigB-1
LLWLLDGTGPVFLTNIVIFFFRADHSLNRVLTRYRLRNILNTVIKSFKHKGLQKFFETGSKMGIFPDHAPKIGRILDRLDASIDPGDMALPGYHLHQLSGKDKKTWSVRVSGNWRITFMFEGEDVILVDYRDYH